MEPEINTWADNLDNSSHNHPYNPGQSAQQPTGQQSSTPSASTAGAPQSDAHSAFALDRLFTDIHAIAENIAAVGRGTSLMHENQRQIGRAFEALMTRWVSAAAESASTSHAAPHNTAAATAAPSNPDIPRSVACFREPRIFDGKAADVEPFIDKVQSAVELSRASLPTDRDKSLYLQSYLANGSARSWYTALRQSDDDYKIDDFAALIEDFRAHFGDPNVEGTALRKIEAMHQTGACAVYASKFRELLVHVDFSESTKIQKFYDGLKEEIKDLFITLPNPPTKFDRYVAKAIEIDNRLHRRHLERQQHAKKTPARSPVQPQPRASTSREPTAPPLARLPTPPGVPMEIDATKTKRPPLTQAEKDRRKREGLCAYCGMSKHFIADCPNMSERAKKQLAARKASSQSGKA